MKEMRTFPELRGLMAKYGITKVALSNVIGVHYVTFSKKLDNEVDFTFSEMWKIKEYFEKMNEHVNMNLLFFDWVLTKVNEEE